MVTYLDQFNIERRLVVRLEERSGIPRFEQLRAQLSVMVAVGRLEPGQRLPTVRDMALQLDLAPGTVARAYRELESDGMVEGHGRAGTFVVDAPPHSEPLRERRERITRLAVAFAFDARQLGASDDEAVAAVVDALTVS